MNFLENIKIAFEAIIANKVRTFLTVLGMVIGVSAVIIMMALGQGARDEIVSQIEGIGANIIVILPGEVNLSGAGTGGGGVFSSGSSMMLGEKTLTAEDLKNIKERIAGRAKFVSGIIVSSNNVEYARKSRSTFINGTEESFIFGNVVELDKGRYVSSGDLKRESRVAFLGYKAADYFFKNENPIGKKIKIKGIAFEIVGVAKDTGSTSMGPSYDDAVMLPLTTANNLFERKDKLDRIIIDINKAEEVDSIKTEIERLILRSHSGKKDFSVMTEKEILSVLDSVLGILTAFLAGIASISLLVGGIGIMNIMLVSVTERTKEIGIRKAVGATNRAILTQFLTEAIFISLLGGMIGIIVSYAVSLILSAKVGFDVSITLNSILLAFLVSVSIGIFFGVAPAVRASGLDPIEALRYE